MKNIKYIGGRGFENLLENSEYLVVYTNEKYEIIRTYFDKLSEARKFFDELNYEKALWLGAWLISAYAFKKNASVKA